MEEYASSIASASRSEDISEINFESLKSCFRLLRNSCVDSNFQTLAGVHPTLLKDSFILLNNLSSKFSSLNEEQIFCFRMGIQFLANLTVKHDTNQTLVWNHCTFFKNLHSLEDMKSRNYASMALNNIILSRPERGVELVADPECLNTIIKDAIQECDFSVILLESLLKGGCFEVMYNASRGRAERSFLLELAEGVVPLPAATLAHLASLFKSSSDGILKAVASYAEAVDPCEFVRLVTLIGKVSSEPQQAAHLQADKSLLINICCLLLAIHKAGKEGGDGPFSPIPRLVPLDWGEAGDHPAFGLKAQLVRSIGNLSYRNKDNQDLVRELDCIPLILDCCNIDAKNPFIMQWAIVCIRHLVEDNEENKALIAGLKDVTGEARTIIL